MKTLNLKVGAQVGVQGREENVGDCNLTLDKPGLNETLASSSTGYTLQVPSTRNIESNITSRVTSELPGTLLNVARETR